MPLQAVDIGASRYLNYFTDGEKKSAVTLEVWSITVAANRSYKSGCTTLPTGMQSGNKPTDLFRY